MTALEQAYFYFDKAMYHSAYYDPITFKYLMNEFWYWLCVADADLLRYE